MFDIVKYVYKKAMTNTRGVYSFPLHLSKAFTPNFITLTYIRNFSVKKQTSSDM